MITSSRMRKHRKIQMGHAHNGFHRELVSNGLKSVRGKILISPSKNGEKYGKNP